VAAAWSDRLVLLRAGSIAADDRTPDAPAVAARLAAVTA
jgi:putative ABC transport system ATP-binding protein